MDVDEQFRSKKCVTNNKEYTMKKQGFTLIELMVVIVIMGILAAVAVPKLFGMIAKSKASEVPTAAGTWINMMEAYGSENYTVGDWGQIGYTAPGTKSTSAKYTSNEFEYTGGVSSNKGTWQAKALHKLDDCPANTGLWALEATVASETATNAGEVHTTAGSAMVAACLALTPAFNKLVK